MNQKPCPDCNELMNWAGLGWECPNCGKILDPTPDEAKQAVEEMNERLRK